MTRKILWNTFDLLLAFAVPLYCVWFTGKHAHPAIFAMTLVLIMPTVAMIEGFCAKAFMTKAEYAEYCNEV